MTEYTCPSCEREFDGEDVKAMNRLGEIPICWKCGVQLELV